MKNLTPKETAEQLVEKYSSLDGNYNTYHYDKQCALICVDEKIETLDRIAFLVDCVDLREYYQEVKKEIEQL